MGLFGGNGAAGGGQNVGTIAGLLSKGQGLFSAGSGAASAGNAFFGIDLPRLHDGVRQQRGWLCW